MHILLIYRWISLPIFLGQLKISVFNAIRTFNRSYMFFCLFSAFIIHFCDNYWNCPIFAFSATSKFNSYHLFIFFLSFPAIITGCTPRNPFLYTIYISIIFPSNNFPQQLGYVGRSHPLQSCFFYPQIYHHWYFRIYP